MEEEKSILIAILITFIITTALFSALWLDISNRAIKDTANCMQLTKNVSVCTEDYNN